MLLQILLFCCECCRFVANIVFCCFLLYYYEVYQCSLLQRRILPYTILCSNSSTTSCFLSDVLLSIYRILAYSPSFYLITKYLTFFVGVTLLRNICSSSYNLLYSVLLSTYTNLSNSSLSL